MLRICQFEKYKIFIYANLKASAKVININNNNIRILGEQIKRQTCALFSIKLRLRCEECFIE